MRWGIPLGLLIALILGLSARGQTGRDSLSSAAPSSGLMNPFNNPYMNPFMNPYAAMQPMDRNATLLYLLKAQDAQGGIGSGQISGSRPAPKTSGTPRNSTAPGGQKPAEMPRTAMTPGAGAAKYFRRSAEPVQRHVAYYGRQNRYFGNNGH